MSKIKYILEEVILESRRVKTIEQYRERLEDSFIDNPVTVGGVTSDDFEEVLEWVESQLPHPKYLEFVLSSMCCGGYGADPEPLLSLVQSFHRLAERNLIKNKDIYSKEYKTPEGSNYVDLSDLYDAVEKATELELTKEQDKKLKGQKDIIYDGPKWRVVVPKSHQASCAYGSGTKWCTTTKNDDSNFKQYTTDAILFYLIDKTSQTYDENVMYKLALNWLFQWNEKSGRFSSKQIDTATLYDSKDNTARLEHVLPLLPEEMIQEIRLYYANTIIRENKLIDAQEDGWKSAYSELQEKFISNGVVNDLMSKIQRDLPNEQVVRLNGGIDDLSVDPSTKTFWFTLNNSTGERDGDSENNPIYNGFIFGNQEMSGKEQLLDLSLHDDNGNEMDSREYLMDFRGFQPLYGRRVSRNAPQDYEGFKKFVGSRKNLFFSLDKKKLVNYLYKKIVGLVFSNSWNRKWVKGEQPYFDSGDKVFWVPGNQASTFTFKYPPKENSLINTFINHIKKNPGVTAKEFYKEVYDFDYYPGYSTQFWGSIKDSGIVRTEKGPYGVHKYYIGPNYKKWTEGDLERYREQSRPWRWRN